MRKLKAPEELKSQKVTSLLSGDLYAALKTLSEGEGLTMSAYIARLIKREHIKVSSPSSRH